MSHEKIRGQLKCQTIDSSWKFRLELKLFILFTAFFFPLFFSIFIYQFLIFISFYFSHFQRQPLISTWDLRDENTIMCTAWSVWLCPQSENCNYDRWQEQRRQKKRVTTETEAKNLGNTNIYKVRSLKS